MSADAPRRLGRGLEALISTARQQRETSPSEAPAPTSAGSDLQRIRIAEISPNHFQPRRTFTEAELAELEASLRANGLLQPITVRPKGPGKWELVAGERRLRAATRLGWTEIPAVVRDFDDRAMLTLALVENLQRSDLNALEEAEGYQRLIDEFGLTQQQVADAVGKDRTTITNLLRVLSLPPSIRELVEKGLLSTGHARALLAIRDPRQQQELAREVVAKQLSVRQTEARARGDLGETAPPQKAGTGTNTSATTTRSADPAVRRLEEQLRRRLQTDVSIQQAGDGKGTVRVAFYSADDLERLLDLMLGSVRSDFD
ncbi:MAG TPA: ParB/RepB/Spo0J family partition protein [Gemmatimonadaceae bacterium]|nr:ParB/RepB/Spo0J family partition protein [Gemmatimonadaceae bacterium]